MKIAFPNSFTIFDTFNRMAVSRKYTFVKKKTITPKKKKLLDLTHFARTTNTLGVRFRIKRVTAAPVAQYS